MDDDNIIGLQNAADIAGVSHMTIKDWCKVYGIGEKVGHQWQINPVKLGMVMQARDCLRLLRA